MSIVEKETLSTVKAVQKFKYILFGCVIEIFSDNRNNLFNKGLEKRNQRWKILIEELGITLKFVKGKENVAADILSRLNTVTEDFTTLNSYIFNLV